MAELPVTLNRDETDELSYPARPGNSSKRPDARQRPATGVITDRVVRPNGPGSLATRDANPSAHPARSLIRKRSTPPGRCHQPLPPRNRLLVSGAFSGPAHPAKVIAIEGIPPSSNQGVRP